MQIDGTLSLFKILRDVISSRSVEGRVGSQRTVHLVNLAIHPSWLTATTVHHHSRLHPVQLKGNPFLDPATRATSILYLVVEEAKGYLSKDVLRIMTIRMIAVEDAESRLCMRIFASECWI